MCAVNLLYAKHNVQQELVFSMQLPSVKYLKNTENCKETTFAFI